MADIETIEKRLATDGKKAKSDKNIYEAIKIYNQVLSKLNE
jgi:hypothetical protein